MSLVFPISILLLFILIGRNFYKLKNKPYKTPKVELDDESRKILHDYVLFYNSLNQTDKDKFEYKVQEFLLNCRITGVKTNVTQKDRILVASSAVIPIFGFPNWRYLNVHEVLLYPNMFNADFELEGEGRRILGMVGNKSLEGIMILSKKALELGFKNESDKKNTAIHEFVHLIDKSDGVIDGVPKVLMEKQYVIPWLNEMNIEIDEIFDGKSDINPYGATNRAEFFSVLSEYFFERPKLLKKKHPELYNLLEQIFNQDMSARNLKRNKHSIHRNDPCVCGGQKKFKDCCGVEHYSVG